MAIGMGIHGEPGISTAALGTADEIIDRILPLLLNELNFNPGDRAAVLLNGLGARLWMSFTFFSAGSNKRWMNAASPYSTRIRGSTPRQWK